MRCQHNVRRVRTILGDGLPRIWTPETLLDGLSAFETRPGLYSNVFLIGINRIKLQERRAMTTGRVPYTQRRSATFFYSPATLTNWSCLNKNKCTPNPCCVFRNNTENIWLRFNRMVLKATFDIMTTLPAAGYRLLINTVYLTPYSSHNSHRVSNVWTVFGHSLASISEMWQLNSKCCKKKLKLFIYFIINTEQIQLNCVLRIQFEHIYNII